jgi:hypothetical protein
MATYFSSCTCDLNSNLLSILSHAATNTSEYAFEFLMLIPHLQLTEQCLFDYMRGVSPTVNLFIYLQHLVAWRPLHLSVVRWSSTLKHAGHMLTCIILLTSWILFLCSTRVPHLVWTDLLPSKCLFACKWIYRPWAEAMKERQIHIKEIEPTANKPQPLLRSLAAVVRQKRAGCMRWDLQAG